MKIFTYAEAQQDLATVLNTAKTEDVYIKSETGEAFSILYKGNGNNPDKKPADSMVKTYKRSPDAADEIVNVYYDHSEIED